MTDWITTNEAKALTGYHPDHIRRLVRAGLVHAEKFGPVWMVDRLSLLVYVRAQEKQGKRRGPKPRH